MLFLVFDVVSSKINILFQMVLQYVLRSAKQPSVVAMISSFKANLFPVSDFFRLENSATHPTQQCGMNEPVHYCGGKVLFSAANEAASSSIQ